jgi:hypothetical protein
MKVDRVEWLLSAAVLGDAGQDGWIWPAEIMRAGRSQISLPGEKRPIYVTASFIAKSAAHFENSPAYGGHVQHSAEQLRALVGTWKNVRASGNAMLGELHLLKSEGWMRDKLLAAKEVGLAIGISFKAAVTMAAARRDGTEMLDTIDVIPSMPRCADIVMHPAAGGRILQAAISEEDASALERVMAGFVQADSDSIHENNSTGVTMKEKILKLLALLRNGQNGNEISAQVAEIEAAVSAEGADYQQLLGKATDLLASVEPGQKPTSNEKADFRLLLTTKLEASRLPLLLQKEIQRRFDNQVVSEAVLDAEITSSRETYAKLVPSGTRISGVTAAHVGMEKNDKLQIAMHRLFGVTHEWKEVCERGMTRMVQGEAVDSSVPGFRSLQAAYTEFTGDVDVTGRFSREISAEFNTAGFPNALGNTLNRLLLQNFAAVDYGIDAIAPQSSRRAVPNFKTQERIRVGDFDDLPQNDPELTDWAELDSPTDEKASYSVVQFGGLVSVTRKTVIDDDIGMVGSIVGKLGRAAKRTLGQRVINLMLANAAIYDGVTWAHASGLGANLRTTALSITEIEAIAEVMYRQTEKDSNKVLALESSILMVPRSLRATAINANERPYVDANYTVNPAKGRFGKESERVVTCPLFTDATDFATFADPEIAPCLEVGFLGGRQDPEILLSDHETLSHKMFTSDRLTYKVRHEYEVAVIDYRGYVRSVVAA